MEKQQATEPLEPQLPALYQEPTEQATAMTLILDQQNMERIIKFGEFMAKGKSTIPAHLAGNSSDCAAVVTQAMMWRMNPYAVAQKTHVVNGQLGYEGQLVNAAVQSSGVTQDRFNYDWFGDWTKVIGKFEIKQGKADPEKPNKKASEYRVPGWTMADEVGLGVRIWATLKGEDEPRELELLLSQASVRNSPLWASDPKQQLAYLAVKRWARLFAPDVMLGVYTPDELNEGRMQDINDRPTGKPAPSRPKSAADVARNNTQNTIIDPDEEIKREKLRADMGAVADNGMEALTDAWNKLSVADRKLLGALPKSFRDRAAAADAKATGK